MQLIIPADKYSDTVVLLMLKYLNYPLWVSDTITIPVIIYTKNMTLRQIVYVTSLQQNKILHFANV